MDFGNNTSDDDEEVLNTNYVNSTTSTSALNLSKSLNDIHMSEKIPPSRPNSLAIRTAENFSFNDHAVSTCKKKTR